MNETAVKIVELIKEDGLTGERMGDLLGIAKQSKDKHEVREICNIARALTMRAMAGKLKIKRDRGKYLRSDEAKAKEMAAWYDVIYETYRIAGRYWFDEFMSAMEFYREPNARFWWPRRKVLEGKHKIATQIQEFMDDPEALYLGFSMPPGTGKSTLIKFLLAFIAGSEPKSANMYVSYSDGMVKMVYDSVVAMTTDDSEYRFKEIFGMNPPDTSAEFKTISYRARGDFPTIGLVSLGGSVTGRTRANRFMVTDDLVKNKEEARSPERLGRLFEDYSSTLTTRMIGDDVKQIQLGTIWSYYDPISRMKREHEGDPRYRFIAIPVMDENGESNFEYEHPDRYTKEKIEALEEALDPVDFSCLYMQNGIQKEGLAFPSDSLTYYNGILPEGIPDRRVFVCDTAFGGGDSLAAPFGYVYGEDCYIVDVVFDKGDKKITEPIMAERIMRHQCGAGRFEANNGGDFYADDVDALLKDKKYHCNITSKKALTTMSKEARIEQYQPDIRRFIYLDRKHQNAEYRAFMDEVTMFSFTSKNLHDDAPDSLGQLAAFLYEKDKMVRVPKFMIRP